MRLLAGVLIAIVSAAAQTPRVGNAKMETRAHGGSLESEFQRVSGPAWVGYAVETLHKQHGCCWTNNRECGCRLEGGTFETRSTSDGKVELEGTARMSILARVVNGKVEKVAFFGLQCELDAGGLPFVWLTGVTPKESAQWLSTASHHAAIAALAMQAGAEAETTLVRMARESMEGKQRGDALFWLAQRAGSKAVGTITEAIERDPDTEVKKKAVFALSQLPKDDGVPKLIEVARNNRNPAVRKQAFFWLGQSRDKRAFDFLAETLAR